MFGLSVHRFRNWISRKIRRRFGKEEPKMEHFPLNRLLCLASRMAVRGKLLPYNRKTVCLLQLVDSLDWRGTTGQGPPKRIRFRPKLPPILE
uniref:Uncharacterized protein n=1 Tax=Steinernema glaseri TaxID=37863 RepID=A0A1I7XYG6_9BILA